jgi:hypothetical protein
MKKLCLIAAALIWGTSASAQTGALNNGALLMPMLQAAPYAAGNSLGGLQILEFFRTVQIPSGILNSLMIASRSGSTTSMTVFIFDARPAASTCVDNEPFALAAGDVSKLAGAPIVVVPAAIGVGTSATFGQAALSVSIRNQDTPPGLNLYVCVLAGEPMTPASPSDLFGKVSGQTN